MEPRIQYVKTEDGVNIAYWTMDEAKRLLDELGVEPPEMPPYEG